MSIVLLGSTSGSCTLQEQAVAGTTTLTLPTFNGTVGLLVSGTAVSNPTSPASSSIDFTGIPAGVRRITVMFSGVSTSGTSSYLVQIGSGSFTIVGYTGQAYSGAGITANTNGFLVNNNVGSASLHVGTVTISLLGSNTYISSGLVGATTAVASLTSSVGGLALGGALDRIRITTFLGVDTFDAGSINILYE